MNKSCLIFLLVVACWSACRDAETKAPTREAAPGAQSSSAAPASGVSQKLFVFFGNSITAGYGLDDLSKGFAAIIQKKIDSMGLAIRCVNAGASGATTADGKESIGWRTAQAPIDYFFLELGGNDALRGIQPASSVQNLQSIIDTVRAKNPSVKIILAGMEAPPQMGNKYTSEFRAMYVDLAKKNNLSLIPFILEGVGGVPALNQSDGIHPTPEGNKIVAETVWKYVKPVLGR